MPNRILREGILTSERVNLLGWAEEVFYRRLMSVVDDFGRYHANAKLIRAACYPLALDKVSDADVEKWLLATEKAALISVYPAEDGKRYLELIDFRQQARAKASKFPQLHSRCVADAAQVSSSSTAYAPVGGGGDGDECEDGGEVVGGGPTDLPDDEAWLANLQRQFADRDVAGERVSFMAFCQRKGTSANRSGFVGWLRKASPKLQPAKTELLQSSSTNIERLEFPANLQTPEFVKAWEGYLEYRKNGRMKSLLPTSQVAQLKKMSEWGHDAAIKAINESISQGWQGIFEPKAAFNGKQQKPRAASCL